MVRVHHDVAALALLAHVGPRVSTAPSVAAGGTLEITPHSTLALIGGFLQKLDMSAIMWLYSHKNTLDRITDYDYGHIHEVPGGMFVLYQQT